MTNPQRNTDGRFYARRDVATMADSTGKFRTSIVMLSELYDWSEGALAETIKLAGRPSVLLGPMTRTGWEALKTSKRTGYAEAPTTDAEWHTAEWRS